MTDLATLGFKTDFSSLKAAESAVLSLGQTTSSTFSGIAKGADTVKATSTATGIYAKTVNDAANAHAGFNTQAMAAFHAARSMAEGIAMGIPPAQMLAMQMNHLSYAASGPGGLTGAFKDAFGMLTGMLTPMRLLGGVAAAGAVGMYLLYESVKTTELKFADLQDRIGGTLQSLHGLSDSASLKGISQSDFLTQMQKFGELSLDATHNVGSLAGLFRANGVAISKDVNVNLARTADLVANAANQQEKYRIIQEAGLPATYQWVAYLSQGGQAMRDAANKATGFGDAAEANMIAKAREFDTAWARSWQSFENAAKTAVIDVADYIERNLGQGSFWKNLGVLLTIGKPAGYALTHSNDTPNGRVSQAFDTLGAFNFSNPALEHALTGRGATQSKTDQQNALQAELKLVGVIGTLPDATDVHNHNGFAQ